MNRYPGKCGYNLKYFTHRYDDSTSDSELDYYEYYQPHYDYYRHHKNYADILLPPTNYRHHSNNKNSSLSSSRHIRQMLCPTHQSFLQHRHHQHHHNNRLSNKIADSKMEKHLNSPVYHNFLNAKHIIGKQTGASSVPPDHVKEPMSISNNSLYQNGLKSKTDPSLGFNMNMKSDYSFPSDNQQANYNRDYFVVQKQPDIKFSKLTTPLIHHDQTKIVNNNNEYLNNNINFNQNLSNNQESQTQCLKQHDNSKNNIFPLYLQGFGPSSAQNLSNTDQYFLTSKPNQSLTQATQAKPTQVVNYNLRPASNAQINRLLASPPFQPNAISNVKNKEENAKILSMIRNENKYNELLVENALFIDSPIHLLMSHHKKQRLLKQQKKTHNEDLTNKAFNIQEMNLDEKTTNSNEDKNCIVLDFTRADNSSKEKQVQF